MSKINHKIVGSFRKWRFPWIVGLVCMGIYHYFQLQLYHFYLYFFLAGIITMVSEWMGWGEIRETGLLLRFGSFKRRKIFIQWDYIHKIVEHIEYKPNHVRLGVFGATRLEKDLRIASIGIKLKNCVPESIVSRLKLLEHTTFTGQTIKFLTSQNTLYLYEEPNCGDTEFFNRVAKYVPIEFPVETDPNINEETIVEGRNRFSVLDYCLLATPIIVLLTFID